jgi:hypothetical protein
MMANTIEAYDIKQHDSFFDYWHYNDIDMLQPVVSQRTAEKIADKIRLKQTCEELPAHCFQLLFLS